MITNTIVKLREFSNSRMIKRQSEEKIACPKVIIRCVSYMLALIMLLFAMSTVNVAKAASLSIKIDGISSKYTGKQVNVTFDGSNVNMKSTPGIVINGTSYVSYKNVFGDSKIGATVSYSSKKKTVTIKKYDKTIVMTIGSKTATVNGTSVAMPAAPIKVTYVDKKVSKILVPTEFVAKALGYNYSWTSTATTVTANIETGLVIKYDGKTYAYTGTQASATIDGEKVNLSTLPGIIIDSTSMLQAKKVFTSKAIGATYNYDKAKKSVTISKDDVVIKLTLGSNTAYVNDVKQKMPTAARMITNVVTGKSYVCVPGEFIATTLGLNYQWDSATKTSVITTSAKDDTETPDVDDDTETPDVDDDKDDSAGDTSGSNNGEQTGSDGSTVENKVLATYQLLNQYYDTYNYLAGQTSINITNTSNGIIGDVSMVSKLNDSNTDREVYTIQSTQPFSNVTSSQTDNQIIFSASNMRAVSTTYPFNYDLVTSVQTIYNEATSSVDFQFTLTDKKLTYDLSLSADLCTLTVTVYTNYLNSIELGTSAKGEYIKISSLKSIEPTVIESETTLTLILNNITNSVGDFTFSSPEFSKITGVSSATINNNDLMLNVNRTSNATYTIEKGEDNTYSIVFAVDTNSGANDSDNSSGSNGGSGSDSGNTDTGSTSGKLTYTALKIPMPNGMTIDSVTNEDLYLSKQIKLYLPGNQTSAVNTSTIIQNSSYISKLAVSYTGGSTVITITTTKICGFDYKIENGFLCVAIDTPSKVYDKIVVLDPGHGGSDTGAISSTKVYEKNLNLKILYTLSQELFKECGIKAYYTRTTDTAVNLYDRPKFPAEVEADLFISLHMNSATTTSAKGVEVYYDATKTVNMNGLTGKMMAQTFTNNLSSIMDSTNRGAKSNPKLVVLKYNTVPSVLIELGFLSNSSDLSKLVSESYQVKASESIVATISEFFDEYPTGR